MATAKIVIKTAKALRISLLWQLLFPLNCEHPFPILSINAPG